MRKKPLSVLKGSPRQRVDALGRAEKILGAWFGPNETQVQETEDGVQGVGTEDRRTVNPRSRGYAAPVLRPGSGAPPFQFSPVRGFPAKAEQEMPKVIAKSKAISGSFSGNRPPVDAIRRCAKEETRTGPVHHCCGGSHI